MRSSHQTQDAVWLWSQSLSAPITTVCLVPLSYDSTRCWIKAYTERENRGDPWGRSEVKKKREKKGVWKKEREKRCDKSWKRSWNTHVHEFNFIQALLPQCKPNLSPSQMPEECHDYEDIQWRPYRVADSDLLMYLRAARWINLFFLFFLYKLYNQESILRS